MAEAHEHKEVEAVCTICKEEFTSLSCIHHEESTTSLCAACDALVYMIDFHAHGLNENATKFYHGLADYCLKERDDNMKTRFTRED